MPITRDLRHSGSNECQPRGRFHPAGRTAGRDDRCSRLDLETPVVDKHPAGPFKKMIHGDSLGMERELLPGFESREQDLEFAFFGESLWLGTRGRINNLGAPV